MGVESGKVMLLLRKEGQRGILYEGIWAGSGRGATAGGWSAEGECVKESMK
jgi:hypothetical protein